MTVVARLAGFTVLLALAFGAAAFAGSRIDVHPGKPEADAGTAAEPGMGDEHGAAEDAGAGEHDAAEGVGHDGAAADAVRGLAVSEDGLSLELADARPRRGERFGLAFRVVGDDGATVRDFDVEHTKRMHVIVVRRDMTGFQHLHPTQHADGSWSVPVTLGEPGSYRVFADFAVDGVKYTLADDLTVDGPVRSQPLPEPGDVAESDGFRVTRSGEGEEVAFEVTRDGRPVEVEDYLGAKGHLVALRDGDLAFLHVHPHDDELAFTAELPRPGTYRLFLQFKVGGEVHTAEFTERVR